MYIRILRNLIGGPQKLSPRLNCLCPQNGLVESKKSVILTSYRTYLTPQEFNIRIEKKEVKEFCQKCLEKSGINPAHAEQLSEVLVTADHRGHYSHGLNRIEMYCDDALNDIVSKDGNPEIISETVATAFVDGKNLLGPVVGNFSMDLAIKKAKDGMSCTNTSPLVNPTRSKMQALGTNPIAVSAPTAQSRNKFILDMATSAVAVGKLEMKKRRGEELPLGWAVDKEGNSTKDAEAGLAGGLLPLGGDEITGGYKGYGLSMMVEILCGVLSNSDTGPNVRRWMDASKPANLGQMFMAIDPERFAPDFPRRMDEYVKIMRSQSSVNEDVPVLIPGDPEREHIDEVEFEGGIRYPPQLIESLDQLADRLGVPKMRQCE